MSNTFSTEALMSKLFKWKTSVDYNGVTFYIRIVGDNIIEDARKQSLLESRKVRRALRDPNSDEYLIHLDVVADLSIEEITESLVALSSREAMREYLQRNPRPVLEALGDYPTQEQLEEYETAKDQREEQYLDDMQEYIKGWTNDYRTALSNKQRDQLEGMLKRYRVDRICEDVYSDFFERYVLASSVYSDDTCKKRMFTLAEFNELPSDVRDFVRSSYEKLTISNDDIKN